jgi:hypothetical protein
MSLIFEKYPNISLCYSILVGDKVGIINKMSKNWINMTWANLYIPYLNQNL